MNFNIIFFFYLYIWYFLFNTKPFFVKILSLSLFMFWVGTNYYNSTSPAYQSTFFTNFTNRGSYFHILNLTPYLKFNAKSIYWKKIGFPYIIIVPPKKHVKVKKLNLSDLYFLFLLYQSYTLSTSNFF